MKGLEKKIACMYKSEISVPQISLDLNIAQHTIYRILKRNNIPRRSASEQSKLRYNAKVTTYQIPKRLTARQKQLLAAAVMLYCGEGAKTGNTVDFVNSNPKTHLVFLAFLREVCKVDENKLRLYLYCFTDQNINTIFKFWSKLLKIPISQFTKPYVRNSNGKHGKRSVYGVLHIRYSDKKLLAEILSLSDKIVQKLVS